MFKIGGGKHVHTPEDVIQTREWERNRERYGEPDWWRPEDFVKSPWRKDVRRKPEDHVEPTKDMLKLWVLQELHKAGRLTEQSVKADTPRQFIINANWDLLHLRQRENEEHMRPPWVQCYMYAWLDAKRDLELIHDDLKQLKKEHKRLTIERRDANRERRKERKETARLASERQRTEDEENDAPETNGMNSESEDVPNTNGMDSDPEETQEVVHVAVKRKPGEEEGQELAGDEVFEREQNPEQQHQSQEPVVENDDSERDIYQEDIPAVTQNGFAEEQREELEAVRKTFERQQVQEVGHEDDEDESEYAKRSQEVLCKRKFDQSNKGRRSPRSIGGHKDSGGNKKTKTTEKNSMPSDDSGQGSTYVMRDEADGRSVRRSRRFQ